MRYSKRLAVKLKSAYSRLSPVNPGKVVFDNIAGKGFGENLKYIAEEIHRRSMRTKLYWLVDDINTSVPPWITKIQLGTPRAQHELQTAGFIIYNYRRKWPFKKKKHQIYLQTWHGGYAMKKIEKDAEDQLPSWYLACARSDGNVTDAVIADGKQEEEIYKRAFWLRDGCEILRTGSPRCDILFQENCDPAIRRKVCSALNIDESYYIVLYAPTFRNNGNTDCYLKQTAALIDALRKKYGNVVLLIRLHPNVVKYSGGLYDYMPGRIINASFFPDPQELVIASDLLISDYSSISFDFAMIRKPVFLCFKDLEAYKAERDLYPLFYEVPFLTAYTEEELIAQIETFDVSTYYKKLDVFFSKYPTYNNGTAASQIVDWLVKKGMK